MASSEQSVTPTSHDVLDYEMRISWLKTTGCIYVFTELCLASQCCDMKSVLISTGWGRHRMRLERQITQVRPDH